MKYNNNELINHNFNLFYTLANLKKHNPTLLFKLIINIKNNNNVIPIVENFSKINLERYF